MAGSCGRRDLWLVVSTYALVLTGGVATALLEEVPNPKICPGCRSTIAVASNDDLESVLTVIFTALALALLATVLVIVVTRYRRSEGALRRALGPVLGAGALAMAVLLLQIVVAAYSASAAEPLQYVFLAAFAMVPFAFLVGVLRSRLARSAVGDLLLALDRGRPIRDALAVALGDPKLEIAYWLPERERYVSADGKPLPHQPEGRGTTLVEHGGRPTAALLHDPMISDEPELVEAVAAAAGLWLDNERLQAKLRAEVAFLEAIVNASPSLLCSINREGRIANLNDAAWNASGYVLENDVKGQMFADVFVAPEARDEWNRRFEEAAPAHEEASFEHTFVNQLGERLTIAWSTAPLYDDDGSVRYVVCGGLDITERQRQESERARERDFLRTLADATPSLLVVVDHDGTVVGNSVNKGFERTIGWTEQDMLGRSFLSIFREDEGSDARLGVAAAFNGAEPTERISHWCTRDGGERMIAWTATPIVDGEGRSLALIVGVDATERQRRESELRSSEERLRAAIEASPVAIVEYALDDTITLWNPAAERIFGWTAEQVIGGKAKHQPPGPSGRARRALSPRPGRRGLHPASRASACAATGRTSTSRSRRHRSATATARSSATWPSSPTSRSASARRRSCARRAPASSRPATSAPARPRAKPARRRAATPRCPLPLASPRPVEGRFRTGRGRSRARGGPRGARRRARRAARARARDPPGGPHRSRAWRQPSRPSPHARPYPSSSTSQRTSCRTRSGPPPTT